MPRPGSHIIDPRMIDQVQAIAEAAMTDQCQVRPPAASRSFDAATMTYTDAAGTAVYTGPCRIQPVPTRDHVVDVGGDMVTLRRYSVSIPISAVGIAVDDHLQVTASADPQLVGHVLRVSDVTGGTYEGQRHLICLDDLG